MLVSWTTAVAGCVPDGPHTVYNPDPAVKIPAIVQATHSRDMSVIPEMVKSLDSDDPAIRFYANRALRDLTGQDFGYQYFGDEVGRRAATRRWKNWLAANGAVAKTGS